MRVDLGKEAPLETSQLVERKGEWREWVEKWL